VQPHAPPFRYGNLTLAVRQRTDDCLLRGYRLSVGQCKRPACPSVAALRGRNGYTTPSQRAHTEGTWAQPDRKFGISEICAELTPCFFHARSGFGSAKRFRTSLSPIRHRRAGRQSPLGWARRFAGRDGECCACDGAEELQDFTCCGRVNVGYHGVSTSPCNDGAHYRDGGQY